MMMKSPMGKSLQRSSAAVHKYSRKNYFQKERKRKWHMDILQN